jgi:hypothetical protein
MAHTVCVLLSASDRKRLEAIASDLNRPRKYIERVAVVLAAANRRPVQQVARVVALTCGEPPPGATHWTGRAAAKAVGVSLRSVQRIWQAHQLQPHRVRSFKRSRDPQFAEKMTDIVGLYLDPPAHTVVLSIDEKSQIQALIARSRGRR